MNRVELLAPAGNVQCALAAINAGADAIYMGATKFSARAFADNLDDDELVDVIRIAHIYGVSVYLTLNILLDDEEISDVLPLIEPLYMSGLDGVIIQDFGVARLIRNHFPGLELHASTQMSIMNSTGASYMGERGFNRIVPSRELTIEEVCKIKKDTGLELECFVHGAMCYSYSGMCLMSSIIGGRSGNRGKCAGTCRLPFKVNFPKQDGEYPYSMKDMCTLDIIPDLIDAGIDSFKIEGRMKSPEYVAGVCAMYRKYIDMYYKGGKEAYHVSKKDIKDLYSLYIRTDISEGYYLGKRGRSLITLHDSGYNGQDEKVISEINTKYVHEPQKIPVHIDCTMRVGESIQIMMNAGDIYAYESGEVVEEAQKQPLSYERVLAQLSKLGDTVFASEGISLELSENAFATVSQINEVRRQCSLSLISQIIESNGFVASREVLTQDLPCELTYRISDMNVSCTVNIENACEIAVLTLEQLHAVIEFVHDIGSPIHRLILDYDLLNNPQLAEWMANEKIADEVYVSLPAIYRANNQKVFDCILRNIKSYTFFDGLLVHGLDEIEWAKEASAQLDIDDYKIYADTGVYVHNHESVEFIGEDEAIIGVTIPYELKLSHIYSVVEAARNTGLETSLVVYGRVPLMVSDGCIKRTYKNCDHSRNTDFPVTITDRYNHEFPVFTDCNICTNITYNDRPLSLYNMLEKVQKIKCNSLRLNFTMEKYEETLSIIRGFFTEDDLARDYVKSMESTTGHLKRGV